MRKITIALLIGLCLSVCLLSLKNGKKDCFEVVKIISAEDFYVDFNGNKTFESEERIVFYEALSKNNLLSQDDSSRLGYLSKQFANKKLLHKKVCLKDRNNPASLTTVDGKNYLQQLYENGFVNDEKYQSKVRQNIDYTKNLDLVSYNPVSHKYHKLNNDHMFSSQNITTMLKSDLPKDAKPCKYCYLKHRHSDSNLKNIALKNNYPKEYYEKYAPLYKDNFLEFYITDYTKQYYPAAKCLTTASQALLKEINSARKTIDFAIYGIDKQPQITEALVKAKNRGVKIRWVFDVNHNGETIYKENFSLNKILTASRSDIMLANNGIGSDGQKIKDSIMHNKFFIFDNKKVWTGSANISHTDLSGFNANSAVLINSPEIAEIYSREFEKMYRGEFHQLKTPTEENRFCLGGSKISVYFSPQDKAISKHIVPLINNAKNYVYVPVFVITHKDFVQALINAKHRGVDVKVIVDATSASSKTSSVKPLRDSGVLVKTENRPGKMHMKSIIIDDKYTIVGSMNFTKSGEKYNDENVLIIENPALSKSFKTKFLYFYNDIPEKWLHKNPSAESFNSINSCYDGIDNDFDGKIDSDDEGCMIKK